MRSQEAIITKRKIMLKKAVDYHGHLCLGQVLGILLAERGMDAIGTSNHKKMIVYVENDRCIADAIQISTGTRLGRRSMKLVNYGKMAATFINTKTDIAFRVWVSGKINHMIGKISSDTHKKAKQYDMLLRAHSEDVVSGQRVNVKIPSEEMPGKPKITVKCKICSEKVMDGRHVTVDTEPQCIACARGPYYSVWEERNHEIGK